MPQVSPRPILQSRRIASAARTTLLRLQRSLSLEAPGPSPIRAVLAILTFLLGFSGFVEVYPPCTWQDWSDCLFLTAQLVVGQFPGELLPSSKSPVPVPASLLIARFALPMLLLWIAASALMRRIRQPLRATGAALMRGHLILVGGGAPLPALLAEARQKRRRAVVIAASPMAAPGDAALVTANPSEIETWRHIGLSRAQAVVIAGLDDAAVLGAALTAGQAARKARRPADPLPIICAVTHAGVGALLDDVFRGTDPNDGAVLHATSPARMRARALLEAHPPYRGADVAAGQQVRALVIGFGATGEEIALQLLRIGLVAEDRPALVTVIDPDAERLSRSLRERFENAAPLAGLRFLAEAVDHADGAALAELLERAGPATAIYLCLPDDTANLLTAIAIRRVAAANGAGAPPIYSHQRAAEGLGRHLAAVATGSVDLTRIHAFGNREGRDLDSLTGDALDRRARRIHERYLAEFPPSDPPRSSQRPWPILPDRFRQANRDQADYLPMRLASLGLAQGDAGAAPPAEALEHAARTEHARWAASAALIGWRPGRRDDQRLLHPDLVPYAELAEATRDKDRSVVRATVEGAAPLVAVPVARRGAEDAPALATRLIAAADGVEGLPLMEGRLAEEVEARALRLALHSRPDLRLRLRLDPGIASRLLDWPDAAARDDARWLMNRADQLLWVA